VTTPVKPQKATIKTSAAFFSLMMSSYVVSEASGADSSVPHDLIAATASLMKNGYLGCPATPAAFS
jgi:hypothetical protein